MAADPFAVIEEAVARQRAEEQALQAIAAARCQLVLGKEARTVFFATLALRLLPNIDWSVATVCTDGRFLHLNPSFVIGVAGKELQGVLAHEVMHNALAHHIRRDYRDRVGWNIACDLAINPLLLEAGFELPAGRLCPGEAEYQDLPLGRSAEEYYSLLSRPQAGQDQEPADGAGQPKAGGDPGGCGAVTEPASGSPSVLSQSQAEWDMAVAQAQQVAKLRGELPAGLARLVEGVLQPKTDWRDLLRAFLSQQACNDYSWFPPNRRFLHTGLFLPALRSEELGDIVLAIDTSGSIGAEELARFAAETQVILESFDCRLAVLYHDSRVQHVQRWESRDGLLKLEPVGGGGTNHCCVFEWIEERAESPRCVICLTDLETRFPSKSPALPVLWAVTGTCKTNPPFGIRVHID
jgi:predicted metal-dependent peptidase